MEAQDFTYHVGCKINLYLHIGNLLPDGYHTVETLLYPVPYPYDILSITESTEKHPFTFTCNIEELQTDNIVERAYRYILEYCSQEHIDLPFSYNVTLEKHIPYQAGLGGGSADAGYFLRYFATRFPTLFSSPTLYNIAQRLGSDVPFFLNNTPSYAEGRGEILYESDISLHGMYCLIAEMPYKIDTANAYKELDIFRKNSRKSLTTKNNYSKNNPRMALMSNDFEVLLLPKHQEMRICKERMLQCGAILANVSGSGSSMFGIFRDEETCFKAKISIQDIVSNLYHSKL